MMNLKHKVESIFCTTIIAFFVIRDFFQVQNNGLDQPKPNIFSRLKVQNISTHSGEFEKNSREARNFDGGCRIFYEVSCRDFQIWSQKWLVKKRLEIKIMASKSIFSLYIRSDSFVNFKRTSFWIMEHQETCIWLILETHV